MLPEEGTFIEEKEGVASTHFPEKSKAVAGLFWTNLTPSKWQWIVPGSFIPKKLFVAEWLPYRSAGSCMQCPLQIWELKSYT